MSAEVLSVIGGMLFLLLGLTATRKRSIKEIFKAMLARFAARYADHKVLFAALAKYGYSLGNARLAVASFNKEALIQFAGQDLSPEVLANLIGHRVDIRLAVQRQFESVTAMVAGTEYSLEYLRNSQREEPEAFTDEDREELTALTDEIGLARARAARLEAALRALTEPTEVNPAEVALLARLVEDSNGK